MAKKKFYVDKTRLLVKSEFYNDPKISYWIKHMLHQNGIKTLDDFVDKTICKSSNPMFKSVTRCCSKDTFNEKTGKRIASLNSDLKKNVYEARQIDRMIDTLEFASYILKKYGHKILKETEEIETELEEYKN